MDVGRYRILMHTFPLVLLGVVGQHAGAAEYYFGKEPVQLREQPGTVAVFSETDQNLKTILEFILSADFNLELSHGYSHEIKGWSVWRFPEGSTQAEIIEALVQHDIEEEYFFAPVYAGASGGETIPSNTVLLRWAGEPVFELLDQLRPEQCSVDDEPRPLGGLERGYLVRPGCHSGLALLAYANELAQLEELEFAEPDMIIGGLQKVIPGDPQFKDSWHLHNTNANDGEAGMDISAVNAWDMTTGTEDVVSVIMDTGVQQDHVDVNQGPGNDFTSDSSTDGGPVNSCDNHGTPVAGVLSAPINNELTVGVAPGSRTRSARTFISEVSDGPCSGRWSTQFSWTVNALDWAQAQGARITNNSNSYDQASSAVATKYDETRDAGMVHFASAGNNGTSGMNFPASLNSVNAVSAVDSVGALASFSNFGAGLSVSAPGVGIYVTDRAPPAGYDSGEQFVVLDGTSYASPIAAGVVALLFSRASNLDGREAELFLQASARDLGAAGFDEQYGWGMVNAESALRLLDIFADDLESGDTSRWSTKVPQ